MTLTPRGHVALSRNSFGCHKGGVTGTEQAEARDAAPHPAVHGTAPTTKNFLAQNVTSGKDEME